MRITSLVPGMYASAEVDVGEPKAFHHAAADGGDVQRLRQHRVVVVRREARRRRTPNSRSRGETFVTTGDTRGDQVQILTGIKEGDVVVTAGQIKVQNGAR